MNYLKEVIQKNKILACSYVILGVILAFLNNFSVTYFRQLIDRFNNETLTISTIVVYGVILIVMCIMSYVDVYPVVKLNHGIFLDLKLKALHKISKIDYRKYLSMGTGKLVQRIENAKKEIVDSKVKMTLIHESFFTVFALLVTFIKIGIILYGWATKSITIGAIIALVTLVDNAYTPIAIFNVLFVQYKLDKSAFRRFTDFLNADNDKQLDKGIDVGGERQRLALD